MSLKLTIKKLDRMLVEADILKAEIDNLNTKYECLEVLNRDFATQKHFDLPDGVQPQDVYTTYVTKEQIL